MRYDNIIGNRSSRTCWNDLIELFTIVLCCLHHLLDRPLLGLIGTFHIYLVFFAIDRLYSHTFIFQIRIICTQGGLNFQILPHRVMPTKLSPSLGTLNLPKYVAVQKVKCSRKLVTIEITNLRNCGTMTCRFSIHPVLLEFGHQRLSVIK